MKKEERMAKVKEEYPRKSCNIKRKQVKCLICKEEKPRVGRGLCGWHYQIARNLAKKYGWSELVTKGLALEKEPRGGYGEEYKRIEKILKNNL